MRHHRENGGGDLIRWDIQTFFVSLNLVPSQVNELARDQLE